MVPPVNISEQPSASWAESIDKINNDKPFIQDSEVNPLSFSENEKIEDSEGFIPDNSKLDRALKEVWFAKSYPRQGINRRREEEKR
ncbi:hypothetical protein GQ457_08G025500 [Hibiscus cannabinus]